MRLGTGALAHWRRFNRLQNFHHSIPPLLQHSALLHHSVFTPEPHASTGDRDRYLRQPESLCHSGSFLLDSANDSGTQGPKRIDRDLPCFGTLLYPPSPHEFPVR